MQEAPIATIAAEALQPASSLIDSLLAPRIQRIKIFAAKQEPGSPLSTEELSALFEQYWKRLLRRVSAITTVFLPQQSLPLPTLYETLSVAERYPADNNAQPQLLDAKTLQPGLNYLVVDAAGTGKSTFARHLVLELFSTPARIPLFLELRRIGPNQSLLERLAADIDDDRQHVDAPLLSLLLDDGDFVIVLDGFDELPDALRGKIAAQIADLALHCDQNSLVLTSRLEVALPDIPASSVLAIRPLGEEQARSLLLRFDSVAGLDTGKRLVDQLSAIPYRFLQNPRLLALLYSTYAFNQTIPPTIASHYDSLYNALYTGRVLAQPGSASRLSSRLDLNDFRRLLRAFSFLLLKGKGHGFQSRSAATALVEDAIRLSSVDPASPASFLEDLLLAVPLLVQDATEYRWIDRSIGEFFAAEYLAYALNGAQLIEQISAGSLHSSFAEVFDYLADLYPSLFKRLIAAPLARLALSDYDRILDPYVRSLCFLRTVHLGLFSEDNVMLADQDGVMRPHFPPPSTTSIGVRPNYTFLSLENYFLVLSASVRTQPIPRLAWELLSEELALPEQWRRRRFDSAHDLEALHAALPENQWLPMDSSAVLDCVSLRTIRSLVLRAQSWEGVRHRTDTLWLLSSQRCRDLLAQVQRELDYDY